MTRGHGSIPSTQTSNSDVFLKCNSQETSQQVLSMADGGARTAVASGKKGESSN